MTYFKNVNTLEELRKQYKELLKQYHPDNPNGSTEATQAINAEYDRLFKVLKDKHESKQTSENGTENQKCYENSMHWDEAEDEILRDMLSKIIHLADITIEIIGNWIWISGNTYQYRKELKEMNFKFAGQKKMWYWHSEAFIKKSKKVLSMDAIRNFYGSTEVHTDSRLRLAEA